MTTDHTPTRSVWYPRARLLNALSALALYADGITEERANNHSPLRPDVPADYAAYINAAGAQLAVNLTLILTNALAAAPNNRIFCLPINPAQNGFLDAITDAYLSISSTGGPLCPPVSP
jgi:hypothetical protein